MRFVRLLLVSLVLGAGVASADSPLPSPAAPAADVPSAAAPPVATAAPAPVAATPAPIVVAPEVPPPPPANPRDAARAEMRQRLDSILQRPIFQDAQVGIEVESLDTGEVLYAHDQNGLFNAASNVKLFTAATALAKLGPEYRFHTDFFCSTPLDHGLCKTLYIAGRGDPMLYTEYIYGIVGELKHRGLRRIGQIVVDDSYFDDQWIGPGWEEEDGDKAYSAPIGALSVNHNTVAIYVRPGDRIRTRAHVELEPDSEYFVIDNSVRTVSRRSRARLRPHSRYNSHDGRQHIVVSGRLPINRSAKVFYKKVDNPPIYAGDTFKAIFRQRGIPVRGKVRRGLVPDDAHRIYMYRSPSLAEIVREMDKVSSNFIAEMLLKTLGAETNGVPGTWPKGIAAVQDYLASIGIPKGSYEMKNGSGLNDTNRFSPAEIVKLLTHVEKQSTFYPEYASSLGIAGRDGTVHARMEGSIADGRLRAKTGTLENTMALSGYVELPSGEQLAYSILVNGLTRRQHRRTLASLDAMGIAIASGGGPEQPTPSTLVTASSDLKARVATFASLAKSPSPDNLPFLRSALRVEHNPILRAVIADTIYQSDPDDGAGDLIDAVPTSPAVFVELRALSQELRIPTPTVSSLIDVAADGNPDALDKLITLAHLAKGDATTGATLADGLEEIGRTAPDELFAALLRAPAGASVDAIALLGQGIAASDDKDKHPFFEKLKALMATQPPTKASADALAVSDRLHKILAEPAPAATIAPPKIVPASTAEKRDDPPAHGG